MEMAKTNKVFEGVDNEDVCIWMHSDEWYEILDLLKIVENLAADKSQQLLIAARREEIKNQLFAHIQYVWELEHGID